MATTQMPADGTAQIPVEPVPQPIELRKEKFAGLLATKVEQGYDIESQGDTEAVLVTRGRKRLFRSPMAGKRQRISIDEQGRTRGGGL
jgi:hypothetical protein